MASNFIDKPWAPLLPADFRELSPHARAIPFLCCLLTGATADLPKLGPFLVSWAPLPLSDPWGSRTDQNCLYENGGDQHPA